MGRNPITRHSSWYDNQLVTDEGEKILSAIDDWAIKKLREHHLVWSGWGPRVALPDIRTPLGSDWGVRVVEDEDWPKLRLFFLSLLWRAAASSRREFSDVRLSADDVERLRVMVLEGNVEPKLFYPVQLIQISTIGQINNQTPFIDKKKIPAVEGVTEHEVPIVRFYFDGLVAHFDMRSEQEIKDSEAKSLYLGSEHSLTIPTISYEASFQKQNLEAIMAEAENLAGRR